MANEREIEILKELQDDLYEEVERIRHSLKYAVVRYNSIHSAISILEGMVDFRELEREYFSELATELKSIMRDIAYNGNGYNNYHIIHSQIEAIEKVIKELEKSK